MSLWPFVRDEQTIARLAAPQDRAALGALLARAWRRHGSSALEDQAELLQNGLSVISLKGNEAQGFLGLHLRAPAGSPPETWADLNLAAVETSSRIDGAFSALTQAALPGLRRAEATGIVCLASPGWLEDGLVRAGFVSEDKVITYSCARMPADEPAPSPAVLRAARPADTDEILRINAEAFGPFWQYDDSVVMGWTLTSDRVVVAEVAGRTAGFAITTLGLAGNYAHLIRVATDLPWRGRGIGRQLVVDAMGFSRREQAPGLALNTQASNGISRRLYESLGFRPTGHVLSAMVYRL